LTRRELALLLVVGVPFVAWLALVLAAGYGEAVRR
jgi:hypothetical protein